MSKAASINRFFFFLLPALLGSFAAHAQLQLRALETAPTSNARLLQLQQRASSFAADTLSLPFWDDFSTSASVPDTNRWQKGPDVAVTNTIAVLPPSVNVATFDGLQASGRPYSQDPNLSGPSDTLLSLPINLGAASLPTAEQPSVYLSFYWQLQGRGNRPDEQDSILLYFLDADSAWHQVWSQGGNEAIDSAAFQQEIIGLQQAGTSLGANFFHAGFQFMFISENRQSGQYDLWHLDYVFLDSNRSSSDIYYQDRTISELPTSLFYPYTAMPISQYFAAPEKYTNPVFDWTAFNLQGPATDEPVDYYIATLNESGDTVANIVERGLFILNGQEYLNIQAPGLEPDALQDYAQQDSLYLTTSLWLISQEPRPYLNFNDTAHIRNVLHDYFAYDDGSAEYGIEVIGNRGVRVAYAFNLEVRDTLTHIDLYLPYFSQGLGGQFVDLKVWKRLNLNGEGTDSLLLTQRDVSLNNSSGLNEFNSYELRAPLVLEPGTFYIGFEKRSDRFLALGFDRNTNHQDKVFVSRDASSWSPGQDEPGSLMMRPRFREGVDPDVLSSKESLLDYPVSIYPNPNRGSFKVISEARQLQVFNSQGQLLAEYAQPAGTFETSIRLEGQPAGLYILKLRFKDATVTKKVLIH